MSEFEIQDCAEELPLGPGCAEECMNARMKEKEEGLCGGFPFRACPEFRELWCAEECGNEEMRECMNAIMLE